MPDPEKMTSKDLAEALSDELPASYHDDCTLETIERLIDNPAEELARLNAHRKSNLTSDELVFILNEAKKMLESSDAEVEGVFQKIGDGSISAPPPGCSDRGYPADLFKGLTPDLEIAKCPWCPDGRHDVALACTDMKHEDAFQVWCRICWAHGPSRETAEEAVKDWNEVSLAIRGEELIRGEKYILLKEHDGQKKGQFIIFRWCTNDGKLNVFSPEGEPDMQSAFSLKVSETDDFVGKITSGKS